MAPLNVEEYQHMEKELRTWMLDQKYQMQGSDRIPLWRVTNTSLTIATGAAIGSFAAMHRFRPTWKFPNTIIPPCAVFYVVFNLARASQAFGILDSILRLNSPLGDASRDILTKFRNGTNVSSQGTSKMGFGDSAVSLGFFNKDHTSHGNTFGGLEEDGDQTFHADGSDSVLAQRRIVNPNPVTAEPDPSELWDPNVGFSWSHEDMQDAQKKRNTWEEIRNRNKKTDTWEEIRNRNKKMESG